jgi:hypothetical protein
MNIYINPHSCMIKANRYNQQVNMIELSIKF